MKRFSPLFLAVPCAFASVAAGAATGDERATVATADFHLVRGGDLDTAERILQYSHDSREGDPVKMLNLAYVMQKKGQPEQAASIYQEILSLDANPYVVTANGNPKRVKTLARAGLERLGYAGN